MSKLIINANSIYDRVIRIGRQTENLVSEITFNLNMWIEEYGAGECVLNVRRNGDGSAYPVPMTIADGMTTWTIKDTDTAKKGRGEIQLVYRAGEKVKTSPIFTISCGESLIGDGEPPSGYEDWLTELNRMTAEVEAAKTSTSASAQTAQAAATSAQASATSAAESATAAEVAQGAAEAAQSAAETAQAAAEAAKTNAQLQAYNARESARGAELAKQVAVNSASTATTKATQATQSATASANSASESAESATASANSASEASMSATSASESAQSASASATTAQNASASASQSASNASASASQASASATSASTSASNAQTSATNASTSATQASESATQASTSATNASASATLAQEYAEQAEESAEHFVLDTKLIKDSTNGVENQAIYPLLGAFPTDSATGSVATFTDGADDIPLKSLVVGINPVQSGEGDPSPENIRPIIGWTDSNVVACDVNVWDEEWELGSYSTTNGEPATYTDRIRSKNRIDVVPNTEYYFKTSNGLTAGNMYFYDVNDVFVSARTTRGNNVTTTPGNCRYMRIAMGLPYGATYNHDISINYPSSDHDYHPYAGQSIPISWESEAGTVYGGSLDVLTGVLTVTDAVIASYNGETLPSTWISDRDVYSTGATPTTGAQVVYKLSEPIEITLDAHELESLYGSNTIYADTGDTAVTYRADPTLYIQRKIAEAISALS